MAMNCSVTQPSPAGPRSGMREDEFATAPDSLVRGCCSPCATVGSGMDKVGIRALRNYASAIVRRARAGERNVITVDGLPVAQIGPLDLDGAGRTLDVLYSSGHVLQLQSCRPRLPSTPIRMASARFSL